MVKPSIFLFLFIIISFCSQSAPKNDSTTIYGNAPSYAGLHLSFEYETNCIIGKRSTLVTFVVDTNGNFKSTFSLRETMRLYIGLGETEGTLILQPGAFCSLELPVYKPLREADRFNPFYKQSPIALAIVEGDVDSLNRTVALFDDEFNEVYVSQVHKLFKKESEKPILPIIAYFDSAYISTNKWFNSYKHFTYHKLYDLTFQRRKESVVSRFFKDGSFEPNNPAYIEAFNSSFYRYIAVKFASTNSQSLKNAWKSRSIDSISNALKISSLLLNDTLREAVLLKNLYDSYYSDLYDKEEILLLVEKAYSGFITDVNKKWAGDILQRMQRLKVGTPSPNFSLFNINGKERNLKKFKGKFLYLNFMNTRNFACKKDLLSLQSLHELLKKDLEIVTILTDGDFQAAKEFVKTNKLNWEFLSIANQSSLIEDFNLTVLPSYFLIDPQGKIYSSPALSPEENFIVQFQEQLKTYKNQELRKNPPKQKSIFDF